jgi:hypothetical protein
MQPSEPSEQPRCVDARRLTKLFFACSAKIFLPSPSALSARRRSSGVQRPTSFLYARLKYLQEL